jgi:hypothetical protein
VREGRKKKKRKEENRKELKRISLKVRFRLLNV